MIYNYSNVKAFKYKRKAYLENMFKIFKMFVRAIPSKASKVLEGLKDRTFSY
jgi:hypothetical protein